MISHRLDTFEKGGRLGDNEGEVGLRWKLPTFNGLTRWGGGIISNRG